MKKSSIVIKGLFQLGITLAALLSPVCTAQTVTFAFENCLAPATGLDTTARVKMLINNLKKGDVEQAAFFVKEKNITLKTQDALSVYDENQQFVVNAGARYHYLKRDTGYALPIDIIKADAALAESFQYQGYVYIKHFPFEGDAEKQQKISAFLNDRGFHPTYVTTPVQDGFLNKTIQARLAANKSLDTRALERIYSQLILEQVNKKAAELQFWFGYQPTQVILLQESDVAAYGILGVIDNLIAAGYRVLPPSNVFSDPIGNPFFYNGFQQAGFMGYLTGIQTAAVEQPLVWSTADEKRTRELIAQEHMDFWYNITNE